MTSRVAGIALLILGILVGAGRASAEVLPQPPNASPFDMVGFIEKATLDSSNDVLSGGTVMVNGTTVTIPRNTIVTMPATFVTWAELFTMAPAPWGPGQTGLALQDSPKPLTTYEITLSGNRLIDPMTSKDEYVAGLVSISQQSLNVATGIINSIDYATGELHVDGPALGKTSSTDVRVQINDPAGRFGRVLTPDARFTADTASPTIRAKTGYPMCIPRTDPATADDPLCPQKNRQVLPNGPILTSFTIGQVANVTPALVVPAVTAPALPTGDPAQQAPFEVGDYITYSGTLQQDGRGPYISAHQIIDNLGIYTSPGASPAYMAIEVTLLGVGGNPIPNVSQENTTKLKIEGVTTDPTRTVDAFAIDVDPCTGAETERLLTAQLTPQVVPWGRFRFRPDFGAFLPPTREWKVRYHGTTAITAANGLSALQYRAPVTAFIFPEGNMFGDPTLLAVPHNFQDFPFLTQGGGPWRGTGPVVGQLTPFPLVLIPGMSPAIPGPITCGTPTVKPPVANAGANQTVASGASVTLNGSASSDPNVPPLALTAFKWAQTGGSGVALSNANMATATFTAPTVPVGGAPVTLNFSLTVTNSAGLSTTAATVVTVSATPPPPPPATDFVGITDATYRAGSGGGRGDLNVTATSSDTTGAAVLTLTTDTGFGPIQMTNLGGGRYSLTTRSVFPAPNTVTVTSSEGGTATLTVTKK